MTSFIPPARWILGILRGVRVVIMAWGLALLTSGASAQTALERAQTLYQEGALPDALTAFHEAVQQGHHDTSTLGTIYWHLGVLSMITGARSEAVRAFERALSLDPNLRVPDELPPEGQEVYQELQESAGRLELRVSSDNARSDRVTTLQIDLRNAPSDFAWELLAQTAPDGAPPWTTTARVGTTMEIPAAAWRGSDRVQLRVVVVDNFGNELAQAQTTLRAPVAIVKPEEADQPSLAANPWLWSGVIAVVIGVVLTAVFLSGSDDRYQGGTISIER